MVRSLFETNSACAWQTEGNIFGIKYLGWILNGQKVILKMCENPKAVANKFPQTFWIDFRIVICCTSIQNLFKKYILYKFQFSVNVLTIFIVLQGIYKNILNLKLIANFSN